MLRTGDLGIPINPADRCVVNMSSHLRQPTNHPPPFLPFPLSPSPPPSHPFPLSPSPPPPLPSRSPSPEPIYSHDGKRLNTREVRVRKRLEDERHDLIQKATGLNAEYKPPADYKCVLTERFGCNGDVLPFMQGSEQEVRRQGVHPPGSSSRDQLCWSPNWPTVGTFELGL